MATPLPTPEPSAPSAIDADGHAQRRQACRLAGRCHAVPFSDHVGLAHVLPAWVWMTVKERDADALRARGLHSAREIAGFEARVPVEVPLTPLGKQDVEYERGEASRARAGTPQAEAQILLATPGTEVLE